MAKLLIVVILLLGLTACKGSSDKSDSNPPDTAVVTPEGGGETDRLLQNKVDLGRLLFHDKVLSGNFNISCSTCHDVSLGTSDGLSLPIGEGGIGLGPKRSAGTASKRVPRHSQALYNLDLIGVTSLFWDGRVATTGGSAFTTPAGDQLPPGLDSVLAAQALFPLTSDLEMAGDPGENEVADAVGRRDFKVAWNLITERVRAIEEYVGIFQAAYPNVKKIEDIQISHIANAIGAYEAMEFRADNSPFDRYLAGDANAMSPSAVRGMTLFYGDAACAQCHTGKFQTDFSFHSIAMPQIGPGTGDGVQGLEDFGREKVTGKSEDRYKFRTPSLRNVAITGPWGHTGAYTSLKTMVMHYYNSKHAMAMYDENSKKPILPSVGSNDSLDFAALSQTAIVDAVRDSDGSPTIAIDFRAQDISDLVSFLKALTDPESLELASPESVPSGLSVD